MTCEGLTYNVNTQGKVEVVCNDEVQAKRQLTNYEALLCREIELMKVIIANDSELTCSKCQLETIKNQAETIMDLRAENEMLRGANEPKH